MPPNFLSTHSRASNMPRSVVKNMHSPGWVNPLTYADSLVRVIFPRSSLVNHILLVGLLTSFIFLSTGSLFQYLRPSHYLRLAGFCGTLTSWSISLPPSRVPDGVLGVSLTG